MLGGIGLVFGILLLLGGATLVCTASNADTIQVLSGAALSALGAIVTCFVVKSMLDWRRNSTVHGEH